MHLPTALLATLALAFHAGTATAAGDAAAGKTTFARRCASCHEVGASARNGFGPQLNGVFGRPAGTAPGFKASTALQASGIVWSEATLAAFLKAPGKVVPGNGMRFLGLGDERQVADVLAYLRAAQP